MPDALAQALALPGLAWLVGAAFLAGCVRGFSGFGAALVYLPVAAQILSPVWALLTLVVLDFAGPLPNLRHALRQSHPPDLARMGVAVALTLPLGLWILFAVPAEVFRYSVSGLTLLLLLGLVSGLRYRGALTPPLVWTTGGLAGLIGGAAGLPGPPVILLYMASSLPAAVVRANTMLFLFLFDVLFLSLLAWQDRLETAPVMVGLLLVVPSMLGNMAGARMFDPERQGFYRLVGYGIIGVSALSGLPLWD